MTSYHSNISLQAIVKADIMSFYSSGFKNYFIASIRESVATVFLWNYFLMLHSYFEHMTETLKFRLHLIEIMTYNN